MGYLFVSPNIKWQCRRGMLELDFLFQRILEQHYDQFSDAQKQLFSQLLQQDDPTLYDWLVADVSCHDATLQPIVLLLKSKLFPANH
jgi:antitoxin CptB